jgi:DNA processing protein
LRAEGGPLARSEEGLPDGWPRRFAGAPADREALAVLLGCASLTPRKLLEMSSRCPRASACLRAVLHGHTGAPAERKRAAHLSGAAVLERVARMGARFVTFDDPEYPLALRDLADPPAGLFVKGVSIAGAEPRVAIVGARNCSPAGRDVAASIAAGLAAAGVCVVSGAARGIDARAHDGALAVGGRTIAVLGSGLDVPYPRENRALISRIAQEGVVVTEYPPGIRALPFRFPARNRIVAALAAAILVVEGAAGSGSMITAEHALDLGREVFAVPGPVTSDLSRVPHELIREGARLIRNADDLLEDLGLHGPMSIEAPRAAERRSSRRVPTTTGAPTVDSGGRAVMEPRGPKLAPEEEPVWRAIQGATAADRVATLTKLPVSAVIGLLIGLELRGLVRQVGGRWERRQGWS